MGRPTAVNAQACPGDRRGGIGRKEGDSIGNIFWSSTAAKWNSRLNKQSELRIRKVALSHRSQHKSRSHRVDSDTEGSCFQSECFGEPFDGVLGETIHRPFRQPDMSHLRRHINDRTLGPGLRHLAQRCLAGEGIDDDAVGLGELECVSTLVEAHEADEPSFTQPEMYRKIAEAKVKMNTGGAQKSDTGVAAPKYQPKN